MFSLTDIGLPVFRRLTAKKEIAEISVSTWYNVYDCAAGHSHVHLTRRDKKRADTMSSAKHQMRKRRT